MISLNNNLATRLSAQKLFEKLLQNKITELDFSNVEIVSRSFANEFINLEKTHDVSIKKKNMSKEVEFMFKTACEPMKSNILRDNNYTTVSVEKYADLI